MPYPPSRVPISCTVDGGFQVGYVEVATGEVFTGTTRHGLLATMTSSISPTGDQLLFFDLIQTGPPGERVASDDHGRGPMRGLKTDRTANVIIRGHAFVQNLRRGHYELGASARCRHLCVAAAFDELIDVV